MATLFTERHKDSKQKLALCTETVSVLSIANLVKMEACLGVEREVVKILDKFTSLRDQNVKTIDELLSIVRNAKAELQTGKFFYTMGKGLCPPI